MDRFNVAAISIACVLGGAILGALIWRANGLATEHYAERFKTCIEAGGSWVPVRGENEGTCIRH